MSKALIKFIRLSPTKARLIARQIQGMNAELAMASLKFMPNKGAKYIANAISSAVANGGFEANEVVVLSCRVDAGAVLKRFQPRARGSASRIRKPTSHIFVEVGKAGEKSELQKLNEKKKTAQSAQVANSGENSAKTSAKAATKANSAVESKKASVNSAEKTEPKTAPKTAAKAENSKSQTPKAPKAEKANSAQKTENAKAQGTKTKETKADKPKTTATKTATAKKTSPKKTDKDA